MDKCINFDEFMRYRLDDEKLAGQGLKISMALLGAQSPRLNLSEPLDNRPKMLYYIDMRYIEYRYTEIQYSDTRYMGDMDG